MEEDNKNITECGEFVCSYFAWLPTEVQKEKGNKLSKMTSSKNKEKKK